MRDESSASRLSGAPGASVTIRRRSRSVNGPSAGTTVSVAMRVGSPSWMRTVTSTALRPRAVTTVSTRASR